MTFVRLDMPQSAALIPDELYELDHDLISAETLKAAMPDIMATPGNFVMGIVEDNKVVGLYWARRNTLTNRLIVYGISMLKEYQKTGGENMRAFKDLSKTIVEQNGFEKTIELYSNHPKIAERYGFTKARCTIMEWNVESEDDNGQGRPGSETGVNPDTEPGGGRR